MSPRYMLELQGDCIPEMIGIYRKGRATTIAFALPHANSWMEAHHGLPEEIKEKVIEAYKKIHAKGVQHGDIGLRHILIGDDHKVTIIDFNYGAALEAQKTMRLTGCEEPDLERELREVRVKLRCKGAFENELRLIERYKELKVLDDIAYEERRRAARAAREAKRSKKRKAPSDANEVQDVEGMYGLTDDECPRERNKVHGVDERLLQTEEGLLKWICKKEVSRRMVVPGRTPDLESLPPFDPASEEDGLALDFFRRVTGEHTPTAATAAVLIAPAAPTATPLQTVLEPESITSRSFWSLPRRVLRRMNRCLSAIFPFAFPNPVSSQSTSPQAPEEHPQERPRKRVRV
jgi:hypothetical protein